MPGAGDTSLPRPGLRPVGRAGHRRGRAGGADPGDAAGEMPGGKIMYAYIYIYVCVTCTYFRTIVRYVGLLSYIFISTYRYIYIYTYIYSLQ